MTTIPPLAGTQYQGQASASKSAQLAVLLEDNAVQQPATDAVSVKLSPQSGMEDKLAKASANLMDQALKLAEKAASSNVSSEERQKLNSTFQAIKGALKGLAEISGGAGTGATTSSQNTSADSSAPQKPLENRLSTADDAAKTGKMVKAAVAKLANDLRDNKISAEQAGKAFSLLSEAGAKTELAASKGTSATERQTLNTDFKKIEAKLRSTGVTLGQKNEVPATGSQIVTTPEVPQNAELTTQANAAATLKSLQGAINGSNANGTGSASQTTTSEGPKTTTTSQPKATLADNMNNKTEATRAVLGSLMKNYGTGNTVNDLASFDLLI
ncbi:MAG: hypothetical protein A2511_13910 [Deltaproteobacteria bacterium RIFOXYD12_FULL_50_9]|nr:MAG: hypothetical protein A2511_13910 [Deltaproteobacteria bacterium RIFOXYD12_FULL_50_9]